MDRAGEIDPANARLNMWNALWIFVGGGLGSLARWGASGFLANRVGEAFPWGTLFVNVTGSLVIGLFAAITDPDGRWLVPARFREFFSTLLRKGECCDSGQSADRSRARNARAAETLACTMD